MAQLTPDRDSVTSRRAAPRFPPETPAGRRSSIPEALGGQPDPSPLILNPVIASPVIPSPVIPSPGAAAQALYDHFLANADRGDHAANDDLVAELVRRIRSRQAAPEGSE